MNDHSCNIRYSYNVLIQIKEHTLEMMIVLQHGESAVKLKKAPLMTLPVKNDAEPASVLGNAHQCGLSDQEVIGRGNRATVLSGLVG